LELREKRTNIGVGGELTDWDNGGRRGAAKSALPR